MLHILKRTNGKAFYRLKNTIFRIKFNNLERRLNNEELLEMKLIQSKNDIENPEIIVQAKILPKKFM